MRTRTSVIIGILAILVIAGFLLYATGYDPFAPEGSDESKEIIRKFIGDPHAVVLFKKSYTNVLGESYDIYRVHEDEFTVDPDTGSVVGAYFLSVPRTKIKKIYLQQAESNAREFAVGHYNDFYSRTMQLTDSEEWDFGPAGIEYSYTWSEQSMNSSTTNIVRVSTSTDGRIVSYYARDKTPPTVEPGTMGKDQAVGTAMKYVIDTTKINNITGKEASAQFTTSADHRDTWVVDVEVRFRNQDGMEDHRGGWVSIDAITGELMKYEPCQ